MQKLTKKNSSDNHCEDVASRARQTSDDEGGHSEVRVKSDTQNLSRLEASKSLLL